MHVSGVKCKGNLGNRWCFMVCDSHCVVLRIFVIVGCLCEV